jgi:hypothetical protein
MSGCYGNSSEDRHFERMCDNYTDQYYGEDLCGCEKTHTEQQQEDGMYEIDEYMYELGDTDEGYYSCGNCDYLFTYDNIKIEDI